MYIVITGTSRGIGLGLTKLALEAGHDVLAVARKPLESSELVELQKKYSKLQFCEVDLMNAEAALKVAACTVKWPHVDVVINNAGIYKGDDTIEDFEKTFLTNSIMPLFVTRELFSQLKKSSAPMTLEISSLMGSIEDNTSGGSYSYRASKAALNMIFKSLSVDEEWLRVLLVHPGWVQTRMGGEKAPVTPEESTKGIWRLVEESKSIKSGTFLNFRGEKLHW